MTTAYGTADGITLAGLTKKYGSLTVLDRLDLHLEPGRVHGLLGPNGAGKTTLMSVICNHVFRTDGTVLVDGEDPAENAHVLEKICFIHEDQRWHDDFNLVQLLSAAPLFFPHWSQATANRLAERFHLPARTKLKKLSRGQRSSLAITISLASRAPYTFLDEPYLGLDASARSLFYDELLREISEAPRTVVMSTHLIDEAANLMEDVTVLRDGRVEVSADVDTITAGAFTVRGIAEEATAFVAHRDVLSRHSLGRIESYLVRGALTPADRERAETERLALESASLQEIVAALGLLESDEPLQGALK